MSNKNKQPTILIVPKGYDLEDLFDVDDGDFNEPPISSEEVKIVFERNDDGNKQNL